jgi:hypothetical protein
MISMGTSVHCEMERQCRMEYTIAEYNTVDSGMHLVRIRGRRLSRECQLEFCATRKARRGMIISKKGG